MATADELLASASTGDNTLVIDNFLRTIQIPSAITNLGVENDDEVLRLKFRMPRHLGETDLSTFLVRINYLNAKGESDVYAVDDLDIVGDNLTFTWLVGPTATRYKGKTKFNVCMKIVDSESYVQKEYNTTIATLPVLEGLEAEEAVVEAYSDILEQWKNQLFGIGDTEEAKLVSKSEEEQQKIVDKGVEVLASIPEDYETTYKLASEGVRTKADAIVCSATGDGHIYVSDSSNDYLRQLQIFGKTTQRTTTGKNLLDHSLNSQTVNGVTLTVADDGSVTVNGMSTANCILLIGTFNFEPGVEYILSGCPTGGSDTTYRMDLRDGDTVKWREFGDGVTVTSSTELDLDVCIRLHGDGTTFDNVVFYPMIRHANTGDSTYEPYTGGKPSPSPAYPQELVPIAQPTVSVHDKNMLVVQSIDPVSPVMNRAFAGIPVPAGGNYVDSNGQQWICDEIDYERGVHIQRIGFFNLADVSVWTTQTSWANKTAFFCGNALTASVPVPGYFTMANLMCDRLMISTPDSISNGFTNAIGQGANAGLYVSIERVGSAEQLVAYFKNNRTNLMYVLAEPVETPLSSVALQNFKMVCTNHPDTYVLNDSGAGMMIKYNADLKTYIDDEKSGLVNACDYGVSVASVGNSSALLEAINKAISIGGAVKIPAGTYVFTKPITLPEGVTVELIGASDAFANSMNRESVGTEYHAKANGTTIIYRGQGAMFRHQSCVFKFENLSLVSQDANKNYLYTSRLVGQTTVNSSTKGKIYAENCMFAGWKTVAGDPYITDELEIVLGGTLTKPDTLEQCCIVASRCRFSFCGAAINMGVDSRLDDCSINKCYYGAAFYGSAGFSTLSNCRIEWCLFEGVIAKQAHDVLVTGCEFDRCGYAAVHYESCTGSSIIGNTMRRSGAEAWITPDAAMRNTHVYVKGCTGGIISDNTTIRKNITDDGTSSTVRPTNAYNIQSNSDMVILGNNFNGCTTGTYNRYTDNTNCRTVGNIGLVTETDSYPGDDQSSENSGQNVDYLLMNSPDGTVWKITVSNSGVITATKVSGGDPENSPGLSSYTIFVPENVSDEWKVTGNYGELDMSTADFLELFYDGFVSAPPSGVTVAKNSIGKDESGQYDMWEYDFCPTNYSRTILLSSGMHTYELSASFGLANFIGHLYTDTGNDAFDYIRNNVRVKVIPVVNPWGFNQYPKTYGNVNGVNPNRNFDLDGAWASFPTYTPEQDECNVKGDSPFCEAEAVNLARWAEANWDAEFWIDCHTGEGHDDKDLWVYYASDAVLLDRINAGISRIETWFKETYGTDCVTTRTIDSEGSIRLFWAEKIAGIPGITLEQAPKRTTFGTSALNEAADISNYSTNISTFVQEFLLEKYRNTVEVNIVSAENPADITMDASTLSVTISAEISPVDTTQNHFLWTSDDDSVCEVYGGSNKAVVVAIGEGTATVTGVNRYDPSIKVTCGITVSYEQMATEITAMSAAVQGVSSTTGELIANNSRMASDFTEVTAGSQLTISCANGYLLKAFEYDSNYALLSDSIGMNFDASEISGTLATDCKYIRLLLKRPDNDIFVVGDISQTEITINENTFKLTEYTTDVSATNQELGVKIGYTLDLTTGVETENANRSVTDFIPLNGASMTFGFDANYAYAAKAFNTDKSLSSANISGHIPNWGHGACTLPSSVQSGLGYIRFLVKNSDNSAMTDIPRYIVINDEIYMLVAVE